MSLVLGVGLEHSCPWPREGLSSEGLSLALASDFLCVHGLSLGLELCVLDSTSGAVGIGVARIFDWGGGANHKSHAMTSSEVFKKGTFCEAKMS